MANKAIHTVSDGDVWINRREGESSGIGGTYDTQAAAVEAGRELARSEGTEHLIHGADGEIRERNSYGNDPYPPKG